MAITSPDAIWTPDSGDDYALTVDLAATADTVQDALNSVKTYTPLTDAERLALTGADLFEGRIVYTTDTNALWKYDGSSWVLFGFGPFSTVTTFNGGSGTVGSSGSFGALTGLTVTQSVTTGVACRAKVTVTGQGYSNASGSFMSVGVGASGATTITPTLDGPGVIRFSSISGTAQAFTGTAHQIVSLSPGTTNFSVLGQAEGTGSTRTFRFITLTIEPVS